MNRRICKWLRRTAGGRDKTKHKKHNIILQLLLRQRAPTGKHPRERECAGAVCSGRKKKKKNTRPPPQKTLHRRCCRDASACFGSRSPGGVLNSRQLALKPTICVQVCYARSVRDRDPKLKPPTTNTHTYGPNAPVRYPSDRGENAVVHATKAAAALVSLKQHTRQQSFFSTFSTPTSAQQSTHAPQPSHTTYRPTYQNPPPHQPTHHPHPPS